MSYTAVVGVNDSIPSRVAVDWSADRVAQRGPGARLVLVHVVGEAHGLPGDVVEGLRSAGRSLLAREEDRVLAAHPGLVVRAELLRGDVAEALTVVSAGADLVVAGTHKTGFIRGRVMGSRSVRIAEEATVPVAVVPESVGRFRSGIVVGVDESADGLAALEFAAREAEHAKQEITLIRAWNAPSGSATGLAFPTPIERRFSAQAERILADAVTTLHRTHPLLATRTRRVRRPTAEALLDSAPSASLLVIGVTRTKDDRTTLGEVAHDVLVNLVGPTVVVHAAETGAAARSPRVPNRV